MAQRNIIIKFQAEGFEKTFASLQEARQAVIELEARATELEEQLKSADAGTAEYQALQKVFQDTRNAIVQLNKEINNSDAGQAIRQVNDDLQETNIQAQAVANTFSSVDDEAVTAFNNIDSSVLSTLGTIEEIETQVKNAEEALKKVKIGSDEFNKLNVIVERGKKQLQAFALEGEAIGLGFKGIGQVGNSVEGLEVKIQQLTAAYSLANDEFQKAEIAQQIQAIRFEVEDLEAQAKQGIFPPGSLGALRAEAEQLELQLRKIPVGTAEYSQIKKRLDDVNIGLNFVSQSAVEQKQLFKDLGNSALSAFGTSAGLLASFAGESQGAQESLLVLQQTLAAVSAFQQIQDTIRLANQAKKVAGLALENKALAENTGATIANASAQGGLSAGLKGVDVASKSAGGGLKALWATLLANPIGAILAALAIVGTVVVALSRKFKPLGDAVNFVIDSFAGVGRATKTAINNFDQILAVIQQFGSVVTTYILNPLDAVKTALNAVGAGFETTKLQKEFDKLGQVAEKAGNTIAGGFKKGFDKSRALRALDAREALNQATKNASEIAEATLGGFRATSDAERAIRVAQLQEDRAIALERLKLENDLTDAELAIIRSGNKEKIKEISKVVDARGEVNQKVLDQLNTFTQVQKSIIDEANNAFKESIQDQIGLVDLRLQAQQKALEAVDSFGNKEKAIQANLNAELQKLELQRRGGEFKTAEEFNLRKLAIQRDFNNQSVALETERQKFIFELNKANVDFQIENEQRLLNRAIMFGNESIDSEIKRINTIQSLRLQSLDAEQKLLEADTANREQNEARLREIERERARISIETTLQTTDARLRGIDRQVRANQAIIDSERQELELQKQLADTQGKIADAELKAIQDSIDLQQQSTFYLNDQLNLLEQRRGLILETQEQELKKLEQERDARLGILETERQTAQLEIVALNAKERELGLLTQEDQLRREALQNQLKLIEAQQADIEVDFKINTDEATEEAKKGIKELGDEARQAIEKDVANPLESALTNGISSFLDKFKDKFGNSLSGYAGGIQSNFQQLVQNALQLLDNLEKAQVASINRQVEQIDKKVEETEKRIDKLTEFSNRALENIKALEQQLNDARGANFEALKTQLNNEQTQRERLQSAIRTQEQEKQRFEQQKIALEERKRQIEKESARRQKVISITQAVINTALGITSALAAPFPVNTILPIAIGAAGAAQVAAIIATPEPAREGGLIDDKGNFVNAKKMKSGGILQGAKHEQGGIPILVGGRVPVEAEGGEAIIPAKAVARNPDVTRDLIAKGSQTNFNLTPVRKFADGGILSLAPSSAVQQTTNQLTTVAQNELTRNTQPIVNVDAVVSVSDINTAQNRVRVIDTNSQL
jgi:tetrahydromethanopterin S-methyltransferase subunit G